MSKSYDVVVIGAGPGGYIAAIRCAQLGMKVACVDNWIGKQGKPTLGGTCLNVGCIPSKALLESSEHYHLVQSGLDDHGITIKGISLDVAKMIQRKDKVVADLTGGIKQLFRSNKIEWLQGHGRVLEGNRVEVTDHNTAQEIVAAENIIIATGSRSVDIPAAPLDGELIVDSTGALEFTETPKRLGVIGAGVIGLELGSVWNRVGSEVVLLEAQDSFLPIADEQISKEAFRQFSRQGLDIRLGARVMATKKAKKSVTVTYQDKDGEKQERFDKLIVAVGRSPYTENLIAPECEILLNEGGFIHVDGQCRTSLPNIYAIGDVIGGPMLAHKGSEEGVAVAEIIAGEASDVHYDIIPGVIYTAPEIAWVGKTTQELKTAGVDFKSGVFPFAANGRARAMDQTVGMIKVIADSNSDRILGVHMIGPAVSELIAEAVLAMEFDGSVEDIVRTIHAHPTLSEAFHEAALAVDKKALHKAN